MKSPTCGRVWQGRLKVHASFDGEPYDGSIVNMGMKTLTEHLLHPASARTSVPRSASSRGILCRLLFQKETSWIKTCPLFRILDCTMLLAVSRLAVRPVFKLAAAAVTVYFHL